MDKLREGVDLYLAGDHSTAVRLLTEYIDEGGEFKNHAYYHIGLVYSDLQQLALSGEYLTKAVELSPNNSMYHYRLGIVYYRLMVLDRAMIHLKKAIEVNPEHNRSRFILGEVYFKLGRMDDAVDTFTRLIELSPDFADAYHSRAEARYHLGDDKAFEQDILKALELNPEHNTARLSLAKHYLYTKKQKRALDNFEIIYNSGFKDYSFIKSYVEALLLFNDRDKAKEIATEALIVYPNNIEIEELIRKCN